MNNAYLNGYLEGYMSKEAGNKVLRGFGQSGNHPGGTKYKLKGRAANKLGTFEGTPPPKVKKRPVVKEPPPLYEPKSGKVGDANWNDHMEKDLEWQRMQEKHRRARNFRTRRW